MTPLTKTQARAAGLIRYFTGKPCKHGHVAERYTASSVCSGCNTAWRNAHPEKMKLAVARWDKANPEKRRALRDRYHKANPRAATEATLRWQKKYPAKHSALSAAYLAKKMSLSPRNADKQAIEDKYEFCRLWSALTGVKHHVDHIRPLSKGGLHVAENLQVLTAKANISKGAHYVA